MARYDRYRQKHFERGSVKLLDLNITNFGALGKNVKVDFTGYTNNDKILILLT